MSSRRRRHGAHGYRNRGSNLQEKGLAIDRRKITDLREERAGLWTRMQEFSEAAEAEGRDLTSSEYEEYKKVEGEFDSLGTRIERLEKEAGIAPQMQRRVVAPQGEPVERDGGHGLESRAEALYRRIAVGGDEEAAGELRSLAERGDATELRRRAQGDRSARLLYFATDEYRDAFETYLRTLNGAIGRALTDEQRVAFAVGVGATGGFTVPVDFYQQLIVRQREFGVIRQLATAVITEQSGDLQVPRVGATRATAAWTAEAAAYVESEDVFEQIILKAYKAAVIAKASEEMVHDSAFDVLGWIARSAGEALGILENSSFVAGASGSTTTPEGIATKATVGVTLATGQTTTITSPDSLLDLYHSVLSPYRVRGSFVLNDVTVKIVRKFKDTTGQYMWQPGLQAGQPDTLLGRPAYTDPDVAVPAANAKSIIFGDVGAAYLIRDVEPVTAQVLSELYAANGQVGFRIHKRVDGDLVDDFAVKTLQHSAT